MFKFLHTADLHLGMRITRFDPATAGRVREARLTALDNIIKKTRDLQVDSVLVAGDLFDDSTVDGTTARRAFEMLESLPAPVYVIPGNHDPLQASGVWDRPPWSQAPPKQLHLVREAKPIEVVPGVLLYPCPVQRKTSMNDPTAWIAGHPRQGNVIRIGMAHGSLRVRDNLPPDDHLIARHAVADLQLDYLALGHWHSRRFFTAPDGVNRTAYSGVHEPMNFQGTIELQTGWVPYGGANREEFFDGGKGEILYVSIAGPGEPPSLEAIDVGHFRWREDYRELTTQHDLEELVQEVASSPGLERQLLRLHLRGTLDAASMIRLDELREILTNRCLLGELDDDELHIEPSEEEVLQTAGQGVLRRVLDRLKAERSGPDPAASKVAERAILLLYQIAREVHL